MEKTRSRSEDAGMLESAADITAAEIDTWILALQEEQGLSTATGNKILQTPRKLLDGAVGHATIQHNPAKAVEPSAFAARNGTH